jgi:hypothetical protein
VLIVGGSGRNWLAIGVQECRVCVDCRANVASMVDLSAVRGAARSVETAFASELRATL